MRPGLRLGLSALFCMHAERFDKQVRKEVCAQLKLREWMSRDRTGRSNISANNHCVLCSPGSPTRTTWWRRAWRRCMCRSSWTGGFRRPSAAGLSWTARCGMLQEGSCIGAGCSEQCLCQGRIMFAPEDVLLVCIVQWLLQLSGWLSLGALMLSADVEGDVHADTQAGKLCSEYVTQAHAERS